MNKLVKMMMMAGVAASLAGCKSESATDFKYTIDSFGDLKVMRYQIPGWENLTLQQKEYAFHLAEAAKWGRDILWDQNCKENLRVRHALEAILRADGIDKQTPEYQDFLVYAKRVFFSNGIHHHYAEDKIFPACSQEYFAQLMAKAVVADEGLLDIIYN
ncbi:MAG: dihydrofolate reductase, partial [Bacteroidales bacterium]|nr:dihydrofolate reductase [Bacteroidales bacterium]